MTARPPRKESLDYPDEVLFEAAIRMLQGVLNGQIQAIILFEDDKLAVIPRPGGEVELMRALREADWPAMLRMAEEWA